MSLDNVTAVNSASADTTVIWTLRTRVAVLGPAVGPVIKAKEGIFLLKTKPDFVLGVGFHQPRGLVAVIVFVGCSIRIPGLAHDQDVVAQADGIWVGCDGSDVNIGVVAGGLASR